MHDGVVRKTKRHQKAVACCAGRYGRQRKLHMLWPAATTGIFQSEIAPCSVHWACRPAPEIRARSRGNPEAEMGAFALKKAPIWP